jgi:hypothetical protein
MKGYRVLKGFWLHSKRYEAGSPIQLTPQEAAHLLRAGKVAPADGDRRSEDGGRNKNPPPVCVQRTGRRPAATPAAEGTEKKKTDVEEPKKEGEK